jgi:hypothetical protein
MNISVIMPTVGGEHIYQCLDSMKYPPNDVVIVVDMIARGAANLQPIEEFEATLKNKYSFITKVVRNENFHDYQNLNQNFNIGFKNAANKYFFITHDDVIYQDFDYFGKLSKVLDILESDGCIIHGKKVWGTTMPVFQSWSECPEGKIFPDKDWQNQYVLSRGPSPIAAAINKNIFNGEANLLKDGGFDVQEGLWYDVIIAREMFKHDWWVMYLPFPPVRHLMSQGFKISDGAGIKLCPRILKHAENHERVYPSEFETEFQKHLHVPFEIPLPDKYKII